MKLKEKMMKQINQCLNLRKSIEHLINTLQTELVCIKTDGTKNVFNRFVLPLKFIEKIHNYEITLQEAIDDQTELKILIKKLNHDYNPKMPKN